MKSIYINASNCHQGGGKILLNAFISGIQNPLENYIFYIDKRYIVPVNHDVKINFQQIKIWERFIVSYKIKKSLKIDDLIIYFGNLPPLIKFKKNKVILLLSNRFYVDSISFKGFSFRDIIKIKLEKLYFKLFKENVNEFIVQTTTMKNLLNKIISNKKILVLPFENSLINNEIILDKEPETYIYVASLLPYKNHKRLIQAWNKLNIDGNSPKLYLTIDQNNYINNWLKSYIYDHNLNVILLENISRQELINIYKRCEFLIYPSYFEAYGLPLIEAVNYNLKILAADVDYCWDLVTPYDFFNPFDVNSIERCILRSLRIYDNKIPILKSKEFINKII